MVNERFKYGLQRALLRVGFDAARLTQGDGLSSADRATVKAVGPYTMTPPSRIVAFCDAVRYVCQRGVAGDIVECGVWRGGSMMAAARTLGEEGETDRDLWLYDTYAGMTDPGAFDLDLKGRSARRGMRRYGRDDSGNSKWCNASLEDVTANLTSTGYPQDRCHYIKGPIEDTIPEHMPERIAILRLDTDWYESTAHEMTHLFPLLQSGGVLILDDYGHWQGARRAVDEALEKHDHPLLLHRIDYGGRMTVVD